MAITFNWLYKRENIKSRLLKDGILEIFKFYNLSVGELSFIFCSDAYLLSINQRFLKHDYYTDIITFDLGESKEIIKGEIYISVERVIENAKALNTTIKEELHRVIFHGVLHLCGFKDKNRIEQSLMRRAEDFWLKVYFER